MADQDKQQDDNRKPQVEEIEPLTDEDELILDAVWARIALRRARQGLGSTESDLDEASKDEE